MEESGTNAGITADASISVSPVIFVSPYDISGAAGTVLTVTGYGFPAYAKIGAGMTAGSTTLTNPATTTNGNGYFSVSGALESSITSTGVQDIILYYNTTAFSQSAFLVSIPNPLNMHFTFSYSGTLYPGSAYSATVYNFPATARVTLELGGYTLATFSTDSNGYGAFRGSIPDIPSGAYTPTAYTGGFYATAPPIQVSALFEVLDPAGNVMNVSFNEYMPSGSTYTVEAFGLNPYTIYTFNDQGAQASGYAGSAVVSVISGKLVKNFEFYPALNGTLMFQFKSVYKIPSYRTFYYITLYSSSGYVSGANSFGYEAVLTPSIYIYPGNSPLNILVPYKATSMVVSNIIPEGSNTYPGVSYYYNVYIGTSEISFTTASGSTTVITSASKSSYATGTLDFNVPRLGNGLYNVSITYNGQSISSAVYSMPVIVSLPGNAYSSGTIQTFQVLSVSGTSMTDTVYVVGYGYYASTVSVYYMRNTGVTSLGTFSTYSGAFSAWFTISSEPNGTYSVFSAVTVSSQTYFVYGSYETHNTFLLSSSAGGISQPINFAAYDLSANTLYVIDFNGIQVGTFSTDSTGYASSVFYVPVVLPGTYALDLFAYQSEKPALSLSFNVTPSSTLVLNTGNFAFPGQLVNFTWTPALLPSTPSASSPYYGPVYVTVYLNNSAFDTFIGYYSQSTNSISGAFVMPNAMPGSYYELTLSWSQATYTTMAYGANYTTVVSTINYMMPPGNGTYLGLVSGNGALLTGITPGQMATLQAQISSTISTSMQVPLSELNASIVAINNAVATIKTAFGNMTASLSAINATVNSISNGVATVKTALGTVQTSLANLNATVLGISNNVVLLNTAVGRIQTTLSAINATLVSVNNGVMTLKTDAGTIEESISAINATVTGINGTVATIMTNAGKVMASLSAINATLASVNNNTATIITNLGTVQVSLKSINATVTSTASSVSSLVGSSATIQTDLGTITGQITSVQNGIATIQTSIGKLNVTTSQIQTTGSSSESTVNTSFYFDIVIIVILVITLAFSLMAYLSARKGPKMPKERKKE
ncbi:MAG: hypothetical protein ACP5MB_04335 [bacterium]